MRTWETVKSIINSISCPSRQSTYSLVVLLYFRGRIPDNNSDRDIVTVAERRCAAPRGARGRMPPPCLRTAMAPSLPVNGMRLTTDSAT